MKLSSNQINESILILVRYLSNSTSLYDIKSGRSDKHTLNALVFKHDAATKQQKIHFFEGILSEQKHVR